MKKSVVGDVVAVLLLGLTLLIFFWPRLTAKEMFSVGGNHAIVEGNAYPASLLIGDAIIKQLEKKINTAVEFPDQSYKLQEVLGVKYLLSPISLIHPKLKLVWQFQLPEKMQLTLSGKTNESDYVAAYPFTFDRGYVYKLLATVDRVAIVPVAKTT